MPAIRLAFAAFKVYLLGRRFVIQTHYRSLKWLEIVSRTGAEHFSCTNTRLFAEPVTTTRVHMYYLMQEGSLLLQKENEL